MQVVVLRSNSKIYVFGRDQKRYKRSILLVTKLLRPALALFCCQVDANTRVVVEFPSRDKLQRSGVVGSSTVKQAGSG